MYVVVTAHVGGSRARARLHPFAWIVAVRRLSVEVSDALHRQAKLAALVEGQTLSSLVIDLLNGYLQECGGGVGQFGRCLSQAPSPSPRQAREAIRA
jgi:hypothetical protein